MGDAIRVLIADDQSLMRAALRLCLDVALMDLRVPEVDGIQATRRLAGPGIEPSVRVLAITGFDLDENILAALRAGASGFLVKDAAADQIVHAVRVVAAGEALLSPSVTRRLLDAYVRFLPAAPPLESTAGLTPRELTGCDWSPTAGATPRSPGPCTWPPARSSPTSPTCWPSSASPTGST